MIIGVAVIVAEVPDEHVYEAIKEICWRQLNPLLALVEASVFCVTDYKYKI